MEFIERRFKKDCNWLNGNCYYFAKILQCRFPCLEMIYFPITGHWAVKDYENNIYDFTGICKIKEPFYTIEWMKENEKEYYERLLFDSMY